VIWPNTFEERLPAWHALRHDAQHQDLDTALANINDWWWRAPMVNHTLIRQDPDSWPGPWDLLAQNSFCDLARALGMLYTVMMLQRGDGKYIMNWSPGTIVNNQSLQTNVLWSISSEALQRLIG
jgi:hypothetical protein